VTEFAGGNTAKLYCLQALDALASSGRLQRIIDLGAGSASLFVPLLRAHPQVHYVAVEPDAEACRAAERNLSGLPAEVVQGFAWDLETEPADAVVSFSVLEHVHDRPRYFGAVARHVTPDGRVWMNVDSGHFTHPLRRDRVKNAIGRGSWFQRFVSESELRALAAGAGLEIVEAKSFNTELKLLYRLAPEGAQAAFTQRWLDFELAANELLPPYTDAHAPYFMTRNVVLRQRGD